MKSLFPFWVNDVGILRKYIGFSKEITIPKQVRCIGEHAFMDNHSVERIYVPDGVRIEEYAFQGCKALKEIRLPNDCHELCYGTFMDCHALEEVHLPNVLKILGGSVFTSCKSLKSIALPPTLKKIGQYAFQSCTKLENISLPDNLKVIEQGAFQNCISLKKMVIPETATDIGKNAFKDCFDLVLTDNRQSKKENQQENQSQNKSQNINNRTEQKYTPSGKEVLVMDGTEVSGLIRPVEHLVIPYGVTAIWSLALCENDCLKSVVIPPTVMYIRANTFQNCKNLEKVTLPKTLKEISTKAFAGCVSLKSININPETTLVDPDAFLGCPSEILPEKLLRERESEFYFEGDTLAKCRTGSKTHIVVPENTKEISASAFFYVSDVIQSVVIPEGVVTIRSTTFKDCRNLVSVTLPESIRSIKSRAFTNCVKLKNLNFPEKLVDITPNAFDNCPLLKVSKKIIQIMQNPPACSTAMAFKNIPDTTIIVRNVILQGGIDVPRLYQVPEIFAVGDNAFMFFDFTEVILPEGMEVIGDGAFAFCDKMTRIVLPSTLKAIGTKAFSCCSSLEIINFPENLEYIGENAFEKCTLLKLPSNIKKLMKNPLHSNYSQITHDPAGLEFPDVPVIRDNVLYRGGKSLGTSAVIPNGIEAIEKGAFMFSDIQKVYIPHGVTFIGASTFAFCKNLEEVILPDTLVKIAETAFFGCPKLAIVDIPESVEYISSDAFQECDNVQLNSHAIQLMNTQNELYELIATFHSSHMDCELLQNNIVHVVFTEEFNIDVDLTNYIIFLNHKTEGNLKIECQNMDGIKRELSVMPCLLYL
ncbi:MAG: leucine-rich repeat domain-containing protein [Clostridia bacterium]|nr:leucine-rich repeat domain-containing protein [Clostridia bacterium]